MSENRTVEKLRKAWLHDVGYLRIANELCLDPEFVKRVYDNWTKESMKYGWGN